MRVLRFTVNPLSSTLMSGAVDLRLPFPLRGKEMHVLWQDGHLIKCSDNEAGELLGQFDYAWAELDEGILPYPYWQETIPGVDVGLIPDWKTFLRDPDPEAEAMPSPPKLTPEVVIP